MKARKGHEMKIYALVSRPDLHRDHLITESDAPVFIESGCTLYEQDAGFSYRCISASLDSLRAEHRTLRRDSIWYGNGEKDRHTFDVESDIATLESNFKIVVACINANRKGK